MRKVRRGRAELGTVVVAGLRAVVELLLLVRDLWVRLPERRKVQEGVDPASDAHAVGGGGGGREGSCHHRVGRGRGEAVGHVKHPDHRAGWLLLLLLLLLLLSAEERRRPAAPAAAVVAVAAGVVVEG